MARPAASPIGFVRVHGVDDTTGFCEQLVAETGVLLLPGSVYDEPGHVRIGFGRPNMPDALGRLEQWVEVLATNWTICHKSSVRFPKIPPIHLPADDE